MVDERIRDSMLNFNEEFLNQLSKGSPFFRLWMEGNGQRQAGQFDAALKVFTEAASLSGLGAEEQAAAYVSIADIHNLKSNCDLAIDYCGLALRTGCRDVQISADAWHIKGMALAEKGLIEVKRDRNRGRQIVDEAIISYAVATAMKPNFAQAWLNLGVAQYNYGRLFSSSDHLHGACISVDTALRIIPTYEKAQAVMKNLKESFGHRVDEAIRSASPDIKQRGKRQAMNLRNAGLAANLGVEDMLCDTLEKKADEVSRNLPWQRLGSSDGLK